MLVFAHFLSTFVDIVGIWILIDRFHVIQGWNFEELALIYGIMQMGFSLAETTGRGFDNFGVLIKSGDFDRVLLRPLGTLFQIAARDAQFIKIGRFFQGLIILLWGADKLHFSLLSSHAAIIALCTLSTASLFYGLMVLQATLAFWTTETLELMHITTYGGLQTGQYPITIYNKSFQLFFTFVIPISCVAFYPVATLLHHNSLPFWIGSVGAPLLGVELLGLSERLV